MSPLPPFIALNNGIIIQTSQISYVRPSRSEEEGAFVLIMSGMKHISLDQHEGQKIYSFLGSNAVSSDHL